MINFTGCRRKIIPFYTLFAALFVGKLSLVFVQGSNNGGEEVRISVDGKSCCADSTNTLENEGTLYCGKPTMSLSIDGKGITKTRSDGSTNTVWWKNLDTCPVNAAGECHWDDSDEEGDDVCMGVDGGCCIDTVTTGVLNGSDGNVYCSRYPIFESEKGITKTYPDGKTNTKYWKNIYACQQNMRGMCHYDER